MRENADGCEVVPTEKLRLLFHGPVDLERVCPLLVEVVIFGLTRQAEKTAMQPADRSPQRSLDDMHSSLPASRT